ncbi:hypothetical protein [Bradyrhizobium zhanjiangense]|uniref:Uncharacterized protein n=1 Tax=Bradyrhizobium zhanjiangense TaxID=1325107 RepID=A0A4Q0QEN5_9BRAD|nr:hypothetical protein [Bradyrhizobium zhanjiangense]RXG89571.1 hypothetical protein EAS61_27865 [Bradyrhizobium zhanjiangense]
MLLRSFIALCWFVMLVTPIVAQPAQSKHVERALAMVDAYGVSLARLTGQTDELIPLRRLRAAAPTLADLNVNKILAQYHPEGATEDTDARKTEQFLQLLADVAGGADSLQRCIDAIDTPEAQSRGFQFLPIGHAMLASRFVPAAVVAGGLRAIDLINRPTLSSKEVSELESNLRSLVRFRQIERQSRFPCDEVVSTYTDIRLRDDADPGFIIRLDPTSAHAQIYSLRN